MHIKISSFLPAMVIAVFAFYGCSGGNNAPTAPTDPVITDIPKHTAVANRYLLGIWEISYDLDTLTAAVTPIRNVQTHFNITQLAQPPSCYHCLEVHVKGVNKSFHVLHLTVKIYNSLGITAFDIRGIIFTDDYGHRLVDSDGWTPLYDIPGGKDINPFKAFMASKYNYDYYDRRFICMAQEVLPFFITIPKPPEFNKIRFALDASFPGNCEEPYELAGNKIQGFSQSDISDIPGGDGYVSVVVWDWQNDVTSVTFSCPEVEGDTPIECYQTSPKVWRADIPNSLGAPPGEYEAIFAAYSEGSGDLAMYRLGNLSVKKPLVTPTTHLIPLSAEFPASDICVPGDGYAYVVTWAGKHRRGLHIYDVSDPANPEWINFVEFTVVYSIQPRIEVSADYAYVVTNHLLVLDISPPEEAHIIGDIYTPEAGVFAIDGDYCYLSGEDYGLRVVDISNPEAPELVHTLNVDLAKPGIAIDGNYAYHLTYHGFAVIDIETPEAASVVTYIEDVLYLKSIVIVDGIAYMAQAKLDGGLVIYDVSDPVHPSHIGTYIFDDYSYEIIVVGQFAFMGHRTCMQIVDVSDIHAPVPLETFPTSGTTSSFAHCGDYVYVGSTGLMQVYHCDPPGTPVEVGYYAGLRNTSPICMQDGILFFTDAGLVLTDPDPVESFNVISKVPVYKTWDVEVQGDYAYMCCSTSYSERGLWIIDISDAENPVVIQEMPFDETWGVTHVTINGDLAFHVTSSDNLLRIIDISEPGSAYVLHETVLDSEYNTLDVHNGTAFAARGVYIYDIDPVEDFHEEFKLRPPRRYYGWNAYYWDAHDLMVDGDYLYVLDEEYGFYVFDISSPYLPIKISSIYIWALEYLSPRDLDIKGNMAYFADKYGIEVIDISDPYHPAFAARYDTGGAIYGLVVGDGYAYARSGDEGFRIFELG